MENVCILHLQKNLFKDTVQRHYTELQKLYQKAIEYRKEIRREIAYLKDSYLMYRGEFYGKPKVRELIEIAEKRAYRNKDKEGKSKLGAFNS